MNKITPWVGVALVITIINGSIYGVSQQQQRSSADFPQVQLAQDAASALNSGVQKLSVTQGKVDMANSLASFVNVYDQDGNVVAGSGLLDGQVPKPPIGVLKAAKGKAYSRVTWEPKTGVRIAAVTSASDKYYVLSGRSMKFAEANVTTTLNISAASEVTSLAVLAVVYFISAKKSSVKDIEPTKASPTKK